MIYHNNIDAVKNFRLEFYQKFKKTNMRKGTLKCQVDMVAARDDSPVLTIEKEGHFYRLNSMYRPEKEAKRWCEQHQFKNSGINVTMFGMGNLLFVSELMKKMKPDSEMYLYEPSLEVFDYILHVVDMTFLFRDSRVVFYVKGVNERDFYYDLAKKTHWSNLAMQIHCCHPKYDEIFPEEYALFNEWILQCDTTEVVNRNTSVFFAKEFTENSIRNLPFLLDGNSIFEYVDKFDIKIPAIIVSAGPSLDKNISLLKEAEGKVFMIATDTAVRHLVKAGVRFDCMVTVDPKKPDWYMRVPECQEIPLFCSLESNADIMHYHKGRKIWFRDSGEYLTNLYHKNGKEFSMLRVGANVAAGAWTICRTLGFRRIIFVGQDLAYGETGTHAGGESNGAAQNIGKQIVVEGIFGEDIQTREDWKMYLDWFEREIATCGDEADVIDATEGGARIHGTSVMTLQEVIEAFCSRNGNVTEVFSDTPASFLDRREELKKELLHAEKEFQNMFSETEKILELSDKALQLLRQTPVNRVNFEHYAKKIAKAHEFVGKQPFHTLLLRYIEGRTVEVLQNINIVTDDEEKDRYDMLVMMREYYKIVKDIMIELQPLVAETLEKIKVI